MKKKITAILMAAALMVSLAACAGSNTESAVTESSTSSAVSSTVSEWCGIKKVDSLFSRIS